MTILLTPHIIVAAPFRDNFHSVRESIWPCVSSSKVYRSILFGTKTWKRKQVFESCFCNVVWVDSMHLDSAHGNVDNTALHWGINVRKKLAGGGCLPEFLSGINCSALPSKSTDSLSTTALVKCPPRCICPIEFGASRDQACLLQ